MGMALAAELNGLPGPRHVLDLAEELGLGREVHSAVQRVVDAMNARAVELELLSPGQRHRYAMLRGYHEGAHGAGGGSR